MNRQPSTSVALRRCISYFLLLLIPFLLVGCRGKAKKPELTRDEYIRSLVLELRKVQEGGNFISIGSNEWFYFIGITDHRDDVEPGGYGRAWGDFIIRDYPSVKLSGIALGIDSTGQVYYSEGVCAMTRWPNYGKRHYSSMAEFMRCGIKWELLPQKYNVTSTNPLSAAEIESRRYPNPSPVVTKDGQAVQMARDFLAKAGVSTNKHDMRQPAEVTTSPVNRMKCWRVAWPPLAGSSNKEDLVVLVFDTGWFSYSEKTQPDAGFQIQGQISNLETGRFVLDSAPTPAELGLQPAE